MNLDVLIRLLHPILKAILDTVSPSAKNESSVDGASYGFCRGADDLLRIFVDSEKAGTGIGGGCSGRL